MTAWRPVTGDYDDPRAVLLDSRDLSDPDHPDHPDPECRR